MTADLGAVAGFQIRPFREEDESSVVELLQATMGDGPAGPRSAEFFRWKHLENPFGRSLLLVAEADDSIIGLRAFMRWRFVSREGPVMAVQAVDTATHPRYQGRGVFSQLTQAALEAVRGDTALVYNTPNAKSLPGYLKMGWRAVGGFRVSVRIRRPVRIARRVWSVRGTVTEPGPAPRCVAHTPAAILARRDVQRLVDESRAGEWLSTDRTLDYLRWRYEAAPGLEYRAVVAEREGSLSGVALFRIRARGTLWEAAVTDVLTAPGDSRTARLLLRDVARASDVDHLACCFRPGSDHANAAARAGFVRSTSRIGFVVNPLRSDVRPDPTSLTSWDLTLGDLEVF